MRENAPKKQKKKPLIMIAVCLLLIIIAGAVLWLTREDESAKDDPLALDNNATMGVLPGIDIAERQAQLQEQLDEGMIAFCINSRPVFAAGGAEGNLLLETPASP